MSRVKSLTLARDSRHAASLFYALSGKRENLTPQQRRTAYRDAMARSFDNTTNHPSMWRKAAMSMLPFEGR